MAAGSLRVLLQIHELRNNGAVYTLLHYAQHLRAAGHRATLLAPADSDPAVRAQFVDAGVALVDQVRLDPPDFDVAIVSTIINGQAVEQLAPALPVVWWIHETRQPGWDDPPGRLRHLFSRATKIAFPSYRLYFEYSDILAVSSPYLADVVPNGFETVDYPPRQPRGDGLFRILCVGSLYPRKRQIDLVRAVLALNDPTIRCTLVGDRYPLTDQYLAEAFANPAQFAFVHSPSNQALRGLYAQSDMFSLPSSDEAFAMSPVEAGQAGLPVVLSDLPTYRYVWTDGSNALIHPVGDVAALARCIKRLKDDPALRRQLGERATEVARCFLREVCVMRLDATVADAIARRRRPPV